jgi:hypothetical protein
MSKIELCAVIVIVFASCRQKETAFENRTPEEKWEIIQNYMVPGAPVSNTRPLLNVLSEQEVLLKAADYTIKKGMVDTSHPVYQPYPALLSAKIETPVLVTNAESGEPGWYLLIATNNDGVFLARMSFKSAVNTSDDGFVGLSSFAFPNSANHFITKREAAELIQSQFPDSEVSEPMAIENLRLEDDLSSHMFSFWYFTVNDNARNAADAGDEYVIATFIPGYPAIPGGVSNRAAIDFAGNRSDIHLNGYRMAKLDKLLRLFDKLDTARAAGRHFIRPFQLSYRICRLHPGAPQIRAWTKALAAALWSLQRFIRLR